MKIYGIDYRYLNVVSGRPWCDWCSANAVIIIEGSERLRPANVLSCEDHFFLWLQTRML